MEIQGDFRPLDPATRKRQSEAAKAAGGDQRPASKAGDAVRLDDASPQQIERFVQILKSMNPADLHRIEELRKRISDGSYTADAESLAGPLADLLDDQTPRADG
jgi:flagellar biosynthesis anti-sigma factor FlgM